MSVRILGSSDLYFEGEGRYRYYGNDPEYINTKSIRRIKTTLEFKKTASENLQIILKLPIYFFNSTRANTFFHVNLLTKSVTCEDPVELNKIRISEITFQIRNWEIRVEGLIEYQKEPDSYPMEFRVLAKFLLKPEKEINDGDVLKLDDISKSLE